MKNTAPEKMVGQNKIDANVRGKGSGAKEYRFLQKNFDGQILILH